MERAFPPLYACKPVVIGVMWLDEHMACKKMGTIGEAKDEAGMLADFAEFMAKWKPAWSPGTDADSTCRF